MVSERRTFGISSTLWRFAFACLAYLIVSLKHENGTVTPAEAGVQGFSDALRSLDSGVRRNDGFGGVGHHDGGYFHGKTSDDQGWFCPLRRSHIVIRKLP